MGAETSETSMVIALTVVMASVFFFFRPLWGLSVLVFLLPFERIGAVAITPDTTVRLSQLAGLALVLAWTASFVTGRTKMRSPEGWRYLWLFAASAGISAATVNYPTVWRNWLILLFYCSLFFVVAQLTTKAALPWLFRSLFVSATIVSVFGLYQYLGDIAGLPASHTGLLPAYTKAVFGFPRIQSTALEPLFFANYLLLPLFVGIALFWRDKVQNWRHSISLFVIGLAFLLTTSRGAFIAAIIGLVSLAVSEWKRLARPKAALSLAGGFILALLMAGGLLGLSSFKNDGNFWTSLNNFVSINTNIASSPSFQERSDQVQIGMTLLTAKQPFGIGLGGIGPRLDGYPRSVVDHFVALNSEGLELIIQVGYIGWILIAAFFVSLLAYSWLAIQSPSVNQGWVVGLAAGMVATLAQAQTFSGFFLTHRWVVFGLLAGLLSEPAKHKFGWLALKRLF